MLESAKKSLSVLIPTKNEERNVAMCIESVSWAGEVYVFDSMSSDRTVEIAVSLGAKVKQRSFDNFADHKNWALDNLPFKFDWLLILDADERVTEDLYEEISGVLKADDVAGYYIPRKNVFMGRWIRHGGWYPDYQLRLFRKGQAKYEKRIVHEHMVVNGPVGYLEKPMLHYDFKGLERYFDRHNTYSSMEAVEAFRILKAKGASDHIEKGLKNIGPERRRYIKEFSYRFVPCRSLVKFFWMFVLKLGFLDGRIGFRYCLLHTFYEYQVSLKIEELNDNRSPMYEKYGHYL